MRVSEVIGVAGVLVAIFFGLQLMGITQKQLLSTFPFILLTIALCSFTLYFLFNINPLEPLKNYVKVSPTEVKSTARLTQALVPMMLLVYVNTQTEWSLAYLLFTSYALYCISQKVAFPIKRPQKEVLSATILPSIAMVSSFLFAVSASFDYQMNVLLAVIVAPIVEEVVFRGVELFRMKNCSVMFAATINSLLFSVFHAIAYQGNVIAFVYLFCLSYGLCCAVIATNNLLPSVAFHMFNNALAIIR